MAHRMRGVIFMKCLFKLILEQNIPEKALECRMTYAGTSG